MERQPTRIDAPAEWRSALTGISRGFLLYETVTGLAIMLLPFSPFNQFNVLWHVSIYGKISTKSMYFTMNQATLLDKY